MLSSWRQQTLVCMTTPTWSGFDDLLLYAYLTTTNHATFTRRSKCPPPTTTHHHQAPYTVCPCRYHASIVLVARVLVSQHAFPLLTYLVLAQECESRHEFCQVDALRHRQQALQRLTHQHLTLGSRPRALGSRQLGSSLHKQRDIYEGARGGDDVSATLAEASTPQIIVHSYGRNFSSSDVSSRSRSRRLQCLQHESILRPGALPRQQNTHMQGSPGTTACPGL